MNEKTVHHAGVSYIELTLDHQVVVVHVVADVLTSILAELNRMGLLHHEAHFFKIQRATVDFYVYTKVWVDGTFFELVSSLVSNSEVLNVFSKCLQADHFATCRHAKVDNHVV